MDTEVVKSFGTLQAELELAKDKLKNVDENLKRIIGRDPSDGPSRLANKRNANGQPIENYTRPRGFMQRDRRQEDGLADKRRNVKNGKNSVFNRLSSRPQQRQSIEDYNPEEYIPDQFYNPAVPKPKIQSLVIRELPTREAVLAAQGDDEKSRGRSRRIFGSLLCTLQKFKQDETRLKPKDEKKAEIIRKVEEQAIREQEEVKKARQDLFMDRKRKQTEIKAIELKMHRMQEYQVWEDAQQPLFHFLQTKATPHIFFKPKVMNKEMELKMKESQETMEKNIDQKRQEVFEELEAIEASTLYNVFDQENHGFRNNFRSRDQNEGEDRKRDNGNRRTDKHSDRHNNNNKDDDHLDTNDKCSDDEKHEENDEIMDTDNLKTETIDDSQIIEPDSTVEINSNDITEQSNCASD